MINTISLFDVPVVSSSKREVMDYVFRNAENHVKTVVFGVGLGTPRLINRMGWYLDFLQSIDINLFDGRNLFYLARLLGYKVECSMSIPELTMDIVSNAKNSGYSIYLLGASETNNNLAQQKLRASKIKCSGHHGYFDLTDTTLTQRILSSMRDYSPEIVLVGMSTPLKEELIVKYKEMCPDAVIVLCGGMIDVLSGEISLTPKLIKSLGLAFVWRLVQEPKKMFPRAIDASLYVLAYFPKWIVQSIMRKSQEVGKQ